MVGRRFLKKNHPWNFKLTFESVCNGSEDIKIPTPMELQIDVECVQGWEDIKISTPVELQIDLECVQW